MPPDSAPAPAPDHHFYLADQRVGRFEHAEQDRAPISRSSLVERQPRQQHLRPGPAHSPRCSPRPLAANGIGFFMRAELRIGQPTLASESHSTAGSKRACAPRKVPAPGSAPSPSAPGRPPAAFRSAPEGGSRPDRSPARRAASRPAGAGWPPYPRRDTRSRTGAGWHPRPSGRPRARTAPALLGAARAPAISPCPRRCIAWWSAARACLGTSRSGASAATSSISSGG